MEQVIRDIGERLKGMRDVLNLSIEDMAVATDVSAADYAAMEAGEKDFNFTFLYKASTRFGIDLTELLTGESPRLSSYELVRSGEGLPIERRKGFKYLNLAYNFRNRLAEPFVVTAPSESGADICELALSTHNGQEMDYVLSGKLRIRIGDHEEILNPGDSIYYNAATPHGMVAIGSEDCRFLAIVISD
jgi:transcriptional regulator with XRE-family HTH domain